MTLTIPTLSTLILFAIGAMVSLPALIKGFARRGTGIIYEKNFVIQRAPQYATFFTMFIVILSFAATNNYIKEPLALVFSQFKLIPETIAYGIAWVGVAILVSGLIFMIGGWYSLGEYFTTDAEVLKGHKIRKVGLLKLVMHPAYSGIIQTVLGSALAANSIIGIILCLAVVIPCWLNRARYEESLLLTSLGSDYLAYAEEMQWRRFVPKFIPFGI